MATKNLQENKNVPVLRFKNFEDVWEEKNYGDIFSFYTTNSYSRDDLNYTSGEVKNIHYGDIHTKFKTLFSIKKENVPFINKEILLSKINKDNYCQVGDLVIADASEDYDDIGKSIEIINLDNQKVLAGLHTFLVRPFPNKTFLGFSSYLMQSRMVRLQIMKIAQGTKVFGLSTTRLSKVKLNIPQLNEQQKIAEFLGGVGEWIENLKEQKESLELYKKGMTQKIFSQQIRFKDQNGKEFPEWKETKLNDCSKRIWIGLVTTMTTNYSSEGTHLIRNQNIRENKIIDESPIYLNNKFSDQHKSRSLKVGDVVTVHTGDVGTSAVIDLEYDGAHGFATLNTRVDSVIINNKYLSYFFNSYKYKNWALRYSTGDGRNNLNLNDFVKSKIPVPDTQEQQKIVNFLNSIDKVIESKQQQISQAEQWKKGLMQGLFV